MAQQRLDSQALSPSSSPSPKMFKFCQLPRELQARILCLADTDALSQVSRTSKTLRDLCLSPSVLSFHIAEGSSPLAAGDLSITDQDEHRSLLKKSLAINAGNLPVTQTPQMNKAHCQTSPLKVSYPSLGGRFKAFLTPVDFEIWDQLYDQCVLSDTLGLQLGDEEMKLHSRTFVSIANDVIVVFRTNDGMGPVERPTLSIECMRLVKSNDDASRIARVDARHTLSYGLQDRSRWWGWYSAETNQVGVLQTPDGFMPSFSGRPQEPSTCGSVQHWDLATIFARAEPVETFHGLGGFNDQLSADRGWYMFMTEEADCKGFPGALIEIPMKSSSGNTPRKSSIFHQGDGPRPECTFIFADADDVSPFDDPYESALETDYQSIPRDRVWYFHVWDAITQRGIAWPTGSKFHFSGPDEQRIDFSIGLQERTLSVKDGKGNCWKASRDSPFMQVDRRWKPAYHVAAMHDPLAMYQFGAMHDAAFFSDDDHDDERGEDSDDM